MVKIKKRISTIFYILRFSSIILFLSSFVFLPSSLVYSAVPHLINYQGRITDTSGTPLDGSYDITFKVYDEETGPGEMKPWEEKHQGVVIQKGVFSIFLGSITNLDLSFDKSYFLEIKVGDDVMSPRQRIASVGYAINAENGIPQGCIVIWSGKITDIPEGWALCDGTKGTPDLRDRFLVGARQDEEGIAKTNVTGSLTQFGDGQLPSHNHSVGTLTITNSGAHIHSISPYVNNLGQQIYANPPRSRLGRDSMSIEAPYNTDISGEHTHAISGSTGVIGTGIKIISVYYALAFIMKL